MPALAFTACTGRRPPSHDGQAGAVTTVIVLADTVGLTTGCAGDEQVWDPLLPPPTEAA